ncbi:MAG: HAMP domain-containing sensor histidine kinase [Micropepsaceae bacterium]
MAGSTMADRLKSWFEPADAETLALRHGQLMHVMTTGRSALVSSIATTAAIAAIAVVWHDLAMVAAFAAASIACAVIAQALYARAVKHAADAADYPRANAYYIAHSFFIVVAMASVGLIWIPGGFGTNVFVMLVLVVCATVRASHQAAHAPSAALSLIYIIVGVGLLLSEPTMLNIGLAVLAVCVTAMLVDVTLRMSRTVEQMLTLSRSERALLDEQKRLVRELREANDAKSQFMARMSHELRTPLNAVIGFSDVMLQQTMGPVGTPVYLDYLKDINSSGAHLLRLINDILDLSKIEAGRFELREGEVDPQDAVDDAFSMVRLRAADGGVTLANEMPRGVMLEADELAFRQVIINLASNAVKFTPAGGTVTCRGGLRADGALEITVSDTGSGIPAEDLEWVFAPFGQSASGYHARERGTGLGLPIVRSLMELHGGTAEIASEVGKGTRVTIAFPARRVHAATSRAAA